MILIPDIHINAKYGEKILLKLEEIFATHDDKEVIFLGDYVYMFSYDRAYLLRLFGLFVSLYKQGRSVKVMSGNHDWIQGHFVFEEGKQAFEIIGGVDIGGDGSLQFITQPMHWVDGTNNLHVIIPYNDHLQEPLQSQYYNNECLIHSSSTEVMDDIAHLSGSSKSGEKLSALVNQIALTYYETNKGNYNQIIIYHHYYTAKLQFPGVKAIFAFRDGALHPGLCEVDNLKLISGHIHEPFSYRNYLCCGSFWHTSSLERNECKYYFVGDPVDGFQAHMIHINPKVVVELKADQDNKSFQEEEFQEFVDLLIVRSQENIQGVMTTDIQTSPLILSSVDLTIKTQSNPKDVEVSESLRNQLHTFHVQMLMEEISSEHFIATVKSDYQNSFSDWKQLLHEYLHYKYPTQQSTLVDFLHRHKIL